MFNHIYIWTTGYGWWFNTEDHVFKATVPSELCVGFEDSIVLIETIFTEQGPFDGILGFSQGAAFVSILCAMMKRKSKKFGKYIVKKLKKTIYIYMIDFFIVLQIEFNFAIMISGFKSLCAPHAKYYDEKIDVPSLHIYGENDQVIPTGVKLQLLFSYSYWMKNHIEYYINLIIYCSNGRTY